MEYVWFRCDLRSADGKEAYEKILKLKPDILITDIKMPGMDGITLLKRLKQEKYPSSL